MKKRLAGIRAIFGVCAMFGWWGLLYPELTMTPDTYAVFWDKSAVQLEEDMIKWDSGSDIYRIVLEADDDRIHFKSKLLTQIDAFIEQLK